MSKASRIECWFRFVTVIGIVVLSSGDDNAVAASSATLQGPDEGAHWGPYLEWTAQNASYSGNPFDVVATVTFSHDASGARHVTEMFYGGDKTWKFRFVGTKPGRWTFRTTSRHDSELDGLSGWVTINANRGARGFIAVKGNQWIWQGNNQRFVPQYTLGKAMKYFREMSEREIDSYIDLFLKEHGFNGLSLLNLELNWFDVEVEG